MTNDAPSNRIGAAVAWSLLVLLLVTNVPLFLCMPLTDDAAMYDLQALNWLHGGMLYRDILEPNLPGVIWLHAAVRWTLGTSSMALRAVDLLLFATFVALSRNWLATSGATRAAQAWSVLILFVCYFSLSEWCHCQRDIWLLVPGLAALTLRCRQIERLRLGRAESTHARKVCFGVALSPSPEGTGEYSLGREPQEDGMENHSSPGGATGNGPFACPPPLRGSGVSVRSRTWGLRPRLYAVAAPRLECTTSKAASEGAARWAFLEGLCWGVGVWLKPMIILPAACCWMLSVLYISNWRRSLVDLLGLMSGGLLIGGLGVAWLVWSGAWPYFVATLVDWNPRYVAAAHEQWTWDCFAAMQVRFFPWQLLHLAAVPIAVIAVGRQTQEWWKSRKVKKSSEDQLAEDQSKSEKVEESKSKIGDAPASSSPGLFDFSTFPLFSLLYLAWLVQSYWLQHLFDYVHAPAMLLAIVLVAAAFGRRAARRSELHVDAALRDAEPLGLSVTRQPSSALRPNIGRFASWLSIAGFSVLVILTTPALRPHRLACWWTCVAAGSTAQVRDQLKTFSVPSWWDLERVAGFLRAQDVRDGEVTCYNSTAVHLYGILGLGPSTRFVYVEQLATYFPSRHGLFLQALSDSRQRYVVTDLIASGLSPSGIARLCADGPLARPPRFPARLRGVYPWSQPAVFRAGPYLVHRIELPLGSLGTPQKRE